MVDLTGKVALVTGGRRGIGLSIARAFRAAGATVVVVAKSPDAGEETWHAPDYYLSRDLVSASARVGLIADVIERCGRFDILVNNAGAQDFGPALTYPMTGLYAMFALHVEAALDLSQQAADWMIRKQAGKIINLTSIAGLQGTRGTLGYTIAKHGVVGLTKSCSNEWARHNIQVNAIAPGYIETDLLAPLTADSEHSAAMLGRIPAGRYGTPYNVAALACFLASDDSNYITGAVIPVDGGWLAR